MSDASYFTLTGDGEASLGSTSGPIDWGFFTATTVPDQLKVFSSVTPARLKYAGWIAYGTFNGGTPNTRCYFDPIYLNFEDFMVPGTPWFIDHIIWSMKPGFTGFLQLWSN